MTSRAFVSFVEYLSDQNQSMDQYIVQVDYEMKREPKEKPVVMQSFVNFDNVLSRALDLLFCALFLKHLR